MKPYPRVSDAAHVAIVDELRRLSLPHHPDSDRAELRDRPRSRFGQKLVTGGAETRRAAIAGHWPDGARL